MVKPTHKQINAVQKVLYDHKRVAQISRYLHDIDRLMNLDQQRPLQPGDVRVEAGAGPQWMYPDTGAIDANVLEASGRCDDIATALSRMSDQLSHVNFHAGDKQHLMGALRKQAAAWTARGEAWRASGPIADVTATVGKISAHERAATEEIRHVKVYLRPASEFRLT